MPKGITSTRAFLNKPHTQRMSHRNRCIVKCGSSVVQHIHHQLATKSASAQDIVTQYLDRIKASDPEIGSFITVDEAGALEQAKIIDESLSQNQKLKPLTGIPIAIKDNIVTKGLQTTAGSKALFNYTPPYDATAIERIRAAGGIIIGKTNMDEFGMGSSTENSAYTPTTRNPWDLDRVPGGSSGGSAAAVAAEQCAMALGSDTGGSIRQPAHFCGVVGVKPTYGRVSRHGLIAYASSLDVIGPLANSVVDAAALLAVIAGPDPSRDATSASSSSSSLEHIAHSVRDSFAAADETRPLKGRRIGVIVETQGEGVDAEVESAILRAAQHMESLGAIVQEVSLPSFALGLPAYYVIALSEASSNLSRYDGVRYGHRHVVDDHHFDGSDKVVVDTLARSLSSPAHAMDLKELYTTSRRNLGAEVRRRILMGTYALSAGYYDAYYKRAQQVRTLIAREMNAALDTYDVLLCPTAPSTAYKVGEKNKDPLAMYKGDLMTVNVNLCGVPAVTLPCGFHSSSDSDANDKSKNGGELPIGMQLIGRSFGEEELLKIAYAYEQTANVFVKSDGLMRRAIA